MEKVVETKEVATKGKLVDRIMINGLFVDAGTIVDINDETKEVATKGKLVNRIMINGLFVDAGTIVDINDETKEYIERK